jgi:hypothetical protein
VSAIETTVMGAIDLILDHAYHEGSDRDLAVAAEAWTLAGYHDGSIDVAHASHGELLHRVANARKGRPRRLLRADARGLLNGLTLLAKDGLLTYAIVSETKRRRWLARGGHDYLCPPKAEEVSG